MTATTLTLTDFLLARIDEAERFAPKYHSSMCEWMMRGDRGATEEDCDCAFAERRKFHLAECEAKRRIVEAYIHLAADPELWAHAWTFALQCLALPYAGHPDYRPEWRP